MRLTVAGDRPVSAAIAAWVRRWRRKASTASQVATAVWLGDERGREERSSKPATPLARNRPTHLPTVLAEVLKRRAASA
jgi:hypothetical protein